VWPVHWLEMSGVEYESEELMAFPEYNGPARLCSSPSRVATKLNPARGSDPFILPVVEDADTFLGVYPPGSDPRGEEREYGLGLKTQLDSYKTTCPDEGGGGGGNGGGNGNGNGNGGG